MPQVLTIKINLDDQMFDGGDYVADAAFARTMKRCFNAFARGSLGQYRCPIRSDAGDPIGYAVIDYDAAEDPAQAL